MAKITKDMLGKKLTQYGGNISACARFFQVSRTAIHNYIKRHPELISVLEDSREQFLDDAESALHKAIKNGDAWAVCFALKTVGRKRGYSERMELKNVKEEKPEEEMTDEQLNAEIEARKAKLDNSSEGKGKAVGET